MDSLGTLLIGSTAGWFTFAVIRGAHGHRDWVWVAAGLGMLCIGLYLEPAHVSRPPVLRMIIDHVLLGVALLLVGRWLRRRDLRKGTGPGMPE